MAGQFVVASSRRLTNANPQFTDYPFTLAAWVNLASTGSNRSIFALADTGSIDNLIAVRVSSAGVPAVLANDGLGLSTSSTTTAISVGSWNFIVLRAISSTNRRLSILLSTGAVEQVQHTTSRSPLGMDTLSVGAMETGAGGQNPWDGLICEFWATASDIYPAGTMDSSLLWQLAYGGPFSVPHVGQAVLDYRSLREHPTADDASETYSRTPQSWINVNGVTIGPHPPLPYWYERPKAPASLVMV